MNAQNTRMVASMVHTTSNPWFRRRNRSVPLESILFLLVALTMVGNGGLAGTWFVDGTAKGSGTGRTWADAWTGPAAIDWQKVQPGDVVCISGGVSGQIYSGPLTVGRDGVEGSPITIAVAQETGRNGLVTILNRTGSAISTRNWITIDGGANPLAPIDSYTNVMNVPSITNNIRLKLIGVHGVNFSGAGPEGVVCRWLDISSVADLDNYQGIRFAPDSGWVARENVIEFCWIHDVGQDGINNPVDSATQGFDSYTVRNCLIEGTGDDGLEVGPSWTVYNSIIRDTRRVRGHPDGIQSVGNYQRYYNNIISDFSSSYIVTQGRGSDYSNIQIYGNLLVVHKLPASSTLVELKWLPIESNTAERSTWHDWAFVNNTIVGAANGSLAIAKREWCTNVMLSRVIVANNLFYQSTNSAVAIRRVASGETTGFWWADTDVLFDNNVIAGDIPETRYFTYGSLWANTSEYSKVGLYRGNRDRIPTMQWLNDHVMMPDPSDLVVRNAGRDLTGLSLVGWRVDCLGNERTTDGHPDIGAVEFRDPRLLVWLDFEDDFKAHDFINDSSGTGHHAWRFGKPASRTNWPNRVPSIRSKGANQSGAAGEFVWFNDGYGLLGKSGYYAGITNVSDFLNLKEATIIALARYYAGPNDSFAGDQNAHIISAGYSVNGAWQLGRYYSGDNGGCTIFNVMTNASASGRDLRLRFPDVNFGNGDTGQWHQYAVTFNRGSVDGYFDGVRFTNVVMNIGNLTVGSYYGGSKAWIGVGCQTHDGTPWMDDEGADGSVDNDYPNHGWFNGNIDDVMIFNRVLSPAEIQRLANRSQRTGAATYLRQGSKY